VFVIVARWSVVVVLLRLSLGGVGRDGEGIITMISGGLKMGIVNGIAVVQVVVMVWGGIKL
jgi:hypothetical protein